MWASQAALVVKDLPASARGATDACSIWVGKIPWNRKWQPTPVFSPGKFHRQRNLAGYSPWGHRVGHDWAPEVYNTFLQKIYKKHKIIRKAFLISQYSTLESAVIDTTAALLGSTSYAKLLSRLLLDTLGLRCPRVLLSSLQSRTVKNTNAQPPAEGARVWQRTPDTRMSNAPRHVNTQSHLRKSAPWQFFCREFAVHWSPGSAWAPENNKTKSWVQLTSQSPFLLSAKNACQFVRQVRFLCVITSLILVIYIR